jgi:hypothetical protein
LSRTPEKLFMLGRSVQAAPSTQAAWRTGRCCVYSPRSHTVARIEIGVDTPLRASGKRPSLHQTKGRP